MPDLLVRNLDQTALDEIRRLAREHRRSLSAEAAALIEVGMRRMHVYTESKASEVAARWRHRLEREGASESDFSTESTRLDRDADHGKSM